MFFERRRSQVGGRAGKNRPILRVEFLEDRLTPAGNFVSDPAAYQVVPEAPVLSRLARFVPSAAPKVSDWVSVSASDPNLDPTSNGGDTNVYVIAHGWAPGFRDMVVQNGTALDPLKWWETLDTSLPASPGGPASPEMFYASASGVVQINPTGVAYAITQADPKAVVLAYSWIDDSATPNLIGGIPEEADLSEAYTSLNGQRLANALEQALPATFNADGGRMHLIGHSHGSKVATTATLALDRTGSANFHVSQLTILDSPEVTSDLVSLGNAANNNWFFLGGIDVSHVSPSPTQTFVDNVISEFDSPYGPIQGVDPFDTTQPSGSLQKVVDVNLNGDVIYDPLLDFGDLHSYSFNWYGGGSQAWAQNPTPSVADQWSPLINPANVPTNGSYSQSWTTKSDPQFALTPGPVVNTVQSTPTFTDVSFAETSTTPGSSYDSNTGDVVLTEDGSGAATFIGKFDPDSHIDGISFQFQFTNVGQGDQLVISADSVILDDYKIAYVMTGTVAGTTSGVGTLSVTTLAHSILDHHLKIQLVPLSGSSGASVTISNLQQFVTYPSLNNAPVVNAAGTPSFGSFDENALDNNGVRVSDLIASAAPTDLITDADAGAAEGIAVTGVDVASADFTPVNDDFNRASLGAGYTTQVGPGFTLNGSVASPTGFSMVALDSINRANVAVQAKVTVGGPGSFIGLVARYAGDGDRNLYLGTLANAGGNVTADIWKNVGGTYTRLTSTPVASSGLLRLEVLGGHLRLFFGGNLVGDVSDSSLASGGKVGLRGMGGTYDDFLIEPAATQPFSFADDFDGRASMGTSYTTQTGSGFTVNGSVAAPTGFSLATYNGIRQANVSTQVDVSLVGPGSFAGLVARHQGSGDNDWYLGTLANNGGVVTAEIWKAVGGTFTRLTQQTVGSGTGTLRLDVLGTSLSLFVNGAPAGQVFDANLGSDGLVGLRGSGATFDNFSIDNALLGTWQFSTNNGGNWANLGSVSDASARLLASDANTRVRFVPLSGSASSPVVPSLMFRGWDQTSGSNGILADVSTNGGATAFSSGTEIATESLFRADSFTGAFGNGWNSEVAGLTVLGDHVVSTTPLGVSSHQGLVAADVAIEANVTVSASGNFVGVLARSSGPGDTNAYAGFLVNRGGQSLTEIWKNVSGAWTRLTTAVVGGAAVAGSIRLEAFGSTLRLFFNGQLTGLAQDASITTPGTVGIRMGNGGPTLDDFKARVLTAPSTAGFADDFNRTDSASLGNAYVETIDAASIVSNHVKIDGFSLVDVPEVKLANVSAAVDVALAPDAAMTAYAGIVLRHTGAADSNGYWAGIVQRGSTFTVELWDAAPSFGDSPLASAPLAGGTGRLRFDAKGSSLKVFVDGVLKIDATDTQVAGVGDVALRGFKANLDGLTIDAL